jgi:hypothetical protein
MMHSNKRGVNVLTNSQLNSRYGNPDANTDGVLDLDWARANLIVMPLPFPMRLSWQPDVSVSRVQCHRLIAHNLVQALVAMESRMSAQALRDHGLDMWGGCFEFRRTRGGTALSRHSWGVAVDMNPDIGRLGSAEDAANYPKFIVDAFKNAGFNWGGDWTDRPDPMHFEIAQ